MSRTRIATFVAGTGPMFVAADLKATFIPLRSIDGKSDSPFADAPLAPFARDARSVVELETSRTKTS
jgi:hypothetical protein